MFPQRWSSKLASFLALQLLLLSVPSFNALPLTTRQSQSTFLQTVQMTDTATGVMTETCVIVLTPIVVDGQPAVEQVKTCTITMNEQGNKTVSATDLPPVTATSIDLPSGSPEAETAPPADSTVLAGTTTVAGEATDTTPCTSQPTPPAGETTSSAIGEVSSATVAAPEQTTSDTTSPSPSPPPSPSPSPSPSPAPSPEVSSDTNTSTPIATESPSDTPGIPSSSPPIVVIGFTTVQGTQPQTTATATDTVTPATAAPQPDATPSGQPDNAPTTNTPAGGTTDTPPAPGTSSGATTGSAAAAEQPSSSEAAEFQLPGKQLSVLPIGLGVFAGISVIALIVVGLVTYERTKYRKAFRQRKLAESGAAMGYGGNAQG